MASVAFSSGRTHRRWLDSGRVVLEVVAVGRGSHTASQSTDSRSRCGANGLDDRLRDLDRPGDRDGVGAALELDDLRADLVGGRSLVLRVDCVVPARDDPPGRYPPPGRLDRQWLPETERRGRALVRRAG